MRKLTVREEKVLGAIGGMQMLLQDIGYQGDCYEYSFDYQGVSIVNPMLDESGRFGVNPFEYYGKYFEESVFMELIEK